MGRCRTCGADGSLISAHLGVCLRCIRERPSAALDITGLVHERTRAVYRLPSSPPRSASGTSCGVCMAGCRLRAGDVGYCGLVENSAGRLVRHGGTEERGILNWYYDPLPTNCVPEWFCPGCTGSGHPRYSYVHSGPERGYSNLAVFYGGCNHDCLFCQNWQHRLLAEKRTQVMSARELASKATAKVSCICFFGGDPSPQMPHALKTSELAIETAIEESRILRICWETNGYATPRLLDRAVELSIDSGGGLKFDLKCHDENLCKALCGVSNQPSIENFRRVGERFDERPDPPLLSASTLLVPGYVDTNEVKSIADLIAHIDESIPYTLLAFAPHYVMDDLPPTSRAQALDCLGAAEEAGLRRVKLGNIHLLW